MSVTFSVRIKVSGRQSASLSPIRSLFQTLYPTNSVIYLSLPLGPSPVGHSYDLASPCDSPPLGGDWRTGTPQSGSGLPAVSGNDTLPF